MICVRTISPPDNAVTLFTDYKPDITASDRACCKMKLIKIAPLRRGCNLIAQTVHILNDKSYSLLSCYMVHVLEHITVCNIIILII